MIRRLIQAWITWRKNREMRRLLHGLGDHTLRDIGLRRDQIDYLRPITSSDGKEAQAPRAA